MTRAALFLVALLFFPPLFTASARELPPKPEYYLVDEPAMLSKKMERAIETLLIEHDRLTGEQVMAALVNDTDGADLREFAAQLFKTWEVGKRAGQNGALLVYSKARRDFVIQTSFGMEARLPEARAAEVRGRVLAPELAQGHSDRAFALAVVDVLTALESPLIQNGEAFETLRGAGFRGDFEPSRAPIAANLGWLWAAFGLALSAGSVLLLTSAEAHYTAGGWFKCSPIRRGRFAFLLKKNRRATFSGGGALGRW